MAQLFAYRALFEPGQENGKGEGVTVVTFPDVPEAITQGRDAADALAMAADALATALLTTVRAGRPLPRPRAKAGELVPVEPDVAAKLALLLAFREAAITQRELGRRLGKDEKAVRRLLDPMHPTKIGPLGEALAVLGRRLVVGVEPLPAA